jgi:hypothetical protein
LSGREAVRVISQLRAKKILRAATREGADEIRRPFGTDLVLGAKHAMMWQANFRLSMSGRIALAKTFILLQVSVVTS